ncbi:hypothetical protein JK175_14090 [Lacticaseibacillus paracasei]|uniref:hypothetical protein n=3 Tax=Lacticaseibacillus paracasei TaxID=1597 RepID=UPI001BA56E8D|nr:hypothetical protein [Lacticaseibacillus paracasei]MBS0992945.1 hypothetical protein [Lacticaseibacillus paracasei]
MLLLSILLICISPLIVVIPAIRWLIVSKRRVLSTLPTALIMGLMGFFYVPSIHTDLTRYFNQLNWIRNFDSFGDYFSHLGASDKILLGQDAMFYSVSRQPQNGILPFLVVVIVAWIGLYVIKDLAQRRQFTWQFTSFLFIAFVMLMPWGTVITNIRYITGVAIFILAAYLDLYRGNKSLLVWLLYLLACTMHLTVVALLAARFLLVLLKRVNTPQEKRYHNAAIIAIVIVLAVFSQTGSFMALVHKGFFYLQGGADGSDVQKWFAQADASVGRSLGKLIERFFILSQCIFILPAIKTTYTRGKQRENQVLLFSGLMLFTTLLLTFMPGTTWVRFALVADFCMVFVIVGEQDYLDNRLLVMINQTAWLGMLLWSVVWQVYQYAGSEVMTRSDYFNIFYPIRWFLQ